MSAMTAVWAVGLVAALAGAGAGAVAAALPEAGFTGSASCRECHAKFYSLWAPSHHGLAMQPYTADFARSNLTAHAEPLTIGGYRYQAEVGPEAGWVRETGTNGQKTLKITYALGGKNVYYFLTPLERGRLQTLPLAYNVQTRAWFDTAASGVRHFPDRPDSPVHWTETPYTFNTSCYGCHVSQITPNYDLTKDAYQTTWREPGINCETCHGPAGEHVRTFRAAATGAPPAEVGLIQTSTMTKPQRNDLCATCHAKMRPITPAFTPGERFFDHFDLVTMENPDFYPDGRDLGENYTFTSWRMSPCATSGQLDCIHCHTSSGRYRFKGEMANNVCLPCHAERVATAPAHTRHKAGTRGNECISCHMPMTAFAHMNRSDHSMRPPAPAATLAFGSPNACNLCHTNRTEDAAWADRAVRQWHTNDYQAPLLRQGALVAAARRQDWSKLPDMAAYLRDAGRDEITGASLLRLLSNCDRPERLPILLAGLQDASPLLRAASAESLAGALTPAAVQALLKATRDDVRLVRVRVASTLAPLPPESVPAEDRPGLEKAVAEFVTAMRARPDDALSHYNLANFHLERRDLERAIPEFEISLRQQPDNLAGLVNASMAFSQAGRNDRSGALLQSALRLDPTNAAANFNYGLLMAESGKRAEAEAALRAALKSDPRMAPAAYNLGVLVSGDRLAEALDLLRRAAALQPQEPKYGYTLAFFQRQGGDRAAAITSLQTLAGRGLADDNVYLLLGQLLEETGRWTEAAAHWRRAAADTRFSERDRYSFGLRASAADDRARGR